MIQSKAWQWEEVLLKDSQWERPSDEFYAVAWRWLQAGRKHVLDLGCGIGRHSLFLATMGFAVDAFDLSEVGVARLKTVAREKGVSIQARVGDMLALPYESGEFDAVLAFHVIYHSDRAGVERVIAEIDRVLRPGGELYVTFNSRNSPSLRCPDNVQIDENTFIKTTGQEAGIPHYYVDDREVRRLLAGFRLIRLTHLEEIAPESDDRSWHYFVLAEKP